MRLSVVIAARNSAEASLRCLESLQAAPQWGTFEVIVVNCLGPDAATIFEKAGAEIVVPGSPQGRITQQRDAGVRRATGDIIAVLHERYQAPREWVGAVLQAHSGNYDIAGGTVAPGAGLNVAAWAMYLSEYWHLCPPADSGPVSGGEATMLAGGNISYKRPVLALGRMASAPGELDFHAALFAAGARFWRESRMQATFATPPTVREYIAERFAVSRDFAAGRSARMGAARRCIAAVVRLALPALVVMRVAKRVFGGGLFRLRFLAALPWMLMFGGVQMIGEMRGFISGDGKLS